jgi:hypothetical protein
MSPLEIGADGDTFNGLLHFGQATVFPAALSGALRFAPQVQVTEIGMAVPSKGLSEEPDLLLLWFDSPGLMRGRASATLPKLSASQAKRTN